MDTRQAETRVGQMVDRYRLEKVLGAGGFGAVFRARHLMMQRDVALKLLHGGAGSSEEIHERFLREARTLARLGHPHVVSVYDCGIANGEAYLAMELLEGEDLAARIERMRALPPSEALRIIEDILGGLAAAHAAGIIHRDLKPANVFLARSAQGETVKLVDFGISKVDGDRLTKTGMILGTPVYMAPESVLGGAASVDARADLYSVGVILFEMLSGRLPYDATSYQGLIVKVATEMPASLASVAPGVPAELAALVDRSIARKPEDRFPDAMAMRDAVARLRGSAPSRALEVPLAFAGTQLPFPTPVGAIVTPHPAMAHTPAPAMAHTPQPAMPFTPAPAMAHTPHPAMPFTAAPTPAPAKKGSSGLVVVVAGAAVAMVAAGVVAVALLVGGDEKAQVDAVSPSVPPVQAPPVQAPPVPVSGKPDEPGVDPEGPKRTLGGAGSVMPSAVTDADGIHVHEPNVVGEAALGDVFRLVDASRAELQRCRGPRDEQVHVHLHVHSGQITLAGMNPNVASTDAEVARCVANVLRDHGPLPQGQGIVQLTFDLARE